MNIRNQTNDFLKIKTQFAVITVKFKQRGSLLEKGEQKIQIELQTVKTLIRLLIF